MSIPPRPSETGYPQNADGPFESSLVMRCATEQVEGVRAQLLWEVTTEPLRDGSVRLNSGWLVGRVWQPEELQLARRLQEQKHIIDWQVTVYKLGERPVMPGRIKDRIWDHAPTNDELTGDYEGGIIVRAKPLPMTPPDETD